MARPFPGFCRTCYSLCRNHVGISIGDIDGWGVGCGRVDAVPGGCVPEGNVGGGNGFCAASV